MPNGTAEKGRRASFWAAVSAIAAAIAVGFSLYSFWRSAETQNEAAAVSAMQNHLELSIDNTKHTVPPNLPNKEYEDLSAGEKEYTWYASHALFTAETIYNLRGESSWWEETDNSWSVAASGFVGRHESYILWSKKRYGDESSVCTEFDPDFVSFMEEEDQIGEDLCTQY